MSAIHLQSDDVHSLPHQYKGRLTGQKPALKPKDVWAIRILLQIHGKTRDLALFNLAIDSKLRSCDLVALRGSDVVVSASIRDRTVIIQQKTGRPVQFELTEQTREPVLFMAVIGWPRYVNTYSGCSPRTSSITDLATRLSTNKRSSPFFTWSSGMMNTLVPSSVTGTSHSQRR